MRFSILLIFNGLVILSDFVIEAEIDVAGEDEMVDQGDVHQIAGLADVVGLRDIADAGPWVARRVVVHDDDCRRVVHQCALDDGASVDGCAGQRAFSQHLRVDEIAAPGEVDTPELLVVEVVEVVAKQSCRLCAGLDLDGVVHKAAGLKE